MKHSKGNTASAAPSKVAEMDFPLKGQGKIGIVCSPIPSAMEIKQGSNNWHAVGFARQGSRVRVHDPAFKRAPPSKRLRDH
jgi:hypothetical protein